MNLKEHECLYRLYYTMSSKCVLTVYIYIPVHTGVISICQPSKLIKMFYTKSTKKGLLLVFFIMNDTAKES